MMQEVKSLKLPHNIIMEDRKKLSVSGVQDVDCFDETLVILFTHMGKLTVRGQNLHVNSFSVDDGDFSMEGEIYSLEYSSDEKAKGSSLLSKLFK